VEYTLDGEATQDNAPTPYIERYIHGAIYEKRSDIHAVVHSHAYPVLPFTISTTPMQPVISNVSDMGEKVPVWDIRDHFGDTNLLVVNMEQGRDLAEGLGNNRVVLMRGHGFSAGARSLIELVKMAVYIPHNATVQIQAMLLGGGMKPLSPGEMELRSQVEPDAPLMWRAWEYWRQRAGIDPGPR
jgi:HCOMODA/2-hydroxy-3-carboxy-muconic semialdehyde decarboxylase